MSLNEMQPGQRALVAPAPSRHVSTDLASAERTARAAAGLGPDAPMVYAVLGIFDNQGKQKDSVEATTVVRFARPAGARPALRTVYVDFLGKPRLFWGPVDARSGYGGMHVHFKDGWLPGVADAVNIPTQRMPSPTRLITWGLQAGLDGNAFVIGYEANAKGLEAFVGTWIEEGGERHVGEVRVFDPLTGLPHKAAAPAGTSEAAPAPLASEAPDEPEIYDLPEVERLPEATPTPWHQPTDREERVAAEDSLR